MHQLSVAVAARALPGRLVGQRRRSGQRQWSAGTPLSKPSAPAASAGRRVGRVVTSCTATLDAPSPSKTPGEKADLRDALITLVSTATLALGMAYFAVGLFTEGPVHGLMSRPFAFPATFLIVIAKFVTNAALVVVDHLCTLFFAVPAYVAFPVALGLLFFGFRNNAVARRAVAQAYLLNPKNAAKPVIEFYGKIRPKAVAAAAVASEPIVDRSAIRAAEKLQKAADAAAKKEAAARSEQERREAAAQAAEDRRVNALRTEQERKAAEAKAKVDREEAAKRAEVERVATAARLQKEKEEAAARAAARKKSEELRAAASAQASAAAEAAAAAAAAKIVEVATAAAEKIAEVRSAQAVKAEEEKYAMAWAKAQSDAREAAERSAAAAAAAAAAEEAARYRNSLLDKSLIELSVLAGQCITRDALESLQDTTPGSKGKAEPAAKAASAAVKKSEPAATGGGIQLPQMPQMPWQKK